jgi:nucleoside-diphosphate-sugar epimerase
VQQPFAVFPDRGSGVSVIVITGARGYIGSALARRFADAGHELRLVSRTGDALRAAIKGAIDYVQADLRTEQAWIKLMAGAGAIVHLSSRTDLRAAEADPTGDERINVEPVRALIRAAARSGFRRRVIFASTTTIVGIEHDNPVDETTPDRPCSVYDRHKLMCETLLREATANGVLRACSLRLSNVYGYGRTSVNANRGILNAMIRRAAHGEALTIYGEGKYIRDFIFLDDVVDAFDRALASEQVSNGDHYVIGTGRGYTIEEAFRCVAGEACRATGREVEVRHVPEPSDLNPIERSNFIGNSRLFQKLTGWYPQVDLEFGIRDYFQRLLAPSRAAGVA